MTKQNISAPAHQKGSMLATSMILLVAVSLISITSMQTATMDLKIEKNYQDAKLAFQIAESTLKQAEKNIEAQPTNFEEMEAMYSLGSEDDDDEEEESSESDCKAGFCLKGEFPPNGTSSIVDACLESAEPLTGSDWSELDIAEQKFQFLTDELNNHEYLGATTASKYIVELLCYTKADPDGPMPETPPPSIEWAELYKVTARGTGGSDSTHIFIQSTYKKQI
jgi:Tfp pilus assembly protein PilX